jgi:hypothetical protein
MTWTGSASNERETEDIQLVAAWMKDLAAAPVSSAPLPDSNYLWWKAELLRRWDAQQKATEPIEVGEQVQMGIGLLAAAGLLVWLWRLLPALLSTTAPTSLSSVSVVTALAFTAVLVAATAAIMVRNVFRQD